MYKSLLGLEFTQTTKRNTKRSNTPSKASFESKLSYIERRVRKVLGHYEKDILVIKDYDTYVNYIDTAISKGIIAIDTETDNTLDTIEGKIMGLCLYVPGEKQVYVPINHCYYKTDVRWSWQLTEDQIGEQLKRLVDEKTYLIFHNGKFDSEVLETNCKLRLPVNWDTEIGARILNENEPAGLKKQYVLHIDKNQERYSIDILFEKERYAYFDPSLFALYAAPDPYMTYRLYEYQKKEFEKEDNEKLYRLFLDIEMPCLEVLQDMEYTGIEIDLGYCERLAKKYHKLFEQLEKEIETEFAKYSNEIAKWRLTKEANAKEKNANGKGFKKSKSEKLSDPIKYSSHEQLAIFFYDILKVDVVNKESPRGTGKDEINSIYEDTRLPICKLLLQYSKMSKLLDAFIDPLPQMVKKSTGRIHCNFNQIGADTGRQSCSKPNLQQIPSKSKEIRLMFKAKDGYSLVSADYSQQEPRLLSNYSKDKVMIDAYKNDKDLYATISSSIYHNNYEDNLEHYADGSIFEEGKARRSKSKAVLLGLMYGMSSKSLAVRIDSTKEEADDILNGFFNSYKNVKDWKEETENKGQTLGYVEDWYGRRRRLPDLMLPDYEVRYFTESEQLSHTFNPFLDCKDDHKDLVLDKYTKLIPSIKNYKDCDKLNTQAKKEGVQIVSNKSKKSADKRKCVNAVIQGGAATMTKKAMIRIYNDEEMKNLGYKLLLSVHDELIGECPNENAEKCAERLSYLMKTCMDGYCDVPFKCDSEISTHWYYPNYISSLQKEYKDLKKSKSDQESLEEMYKLHEESTKEEIDKILLGEE